MKTLSFRILLRLHIENSCANLSFIFLRLSLVSSFTRQRHRIQNECFIASYTFIVQCHITLCSFVCFINVSSSYFIVLKLLVNSCQENFPPTLILVMCIYRARHNGSQQQTQPTNRQQTGRMTFSLYSLYTYLPNYRTVLISLSLHSCCV